MSIPAPRLINTSSFALLLFDYFCTLDREVLSVWPCPISVGTPLFYINRYVPIVDQALMLVFFHHAGRASTCSVLYKTGTWLILIAANCAHVIISLQTCAIWSNHFWIVCIISVLTLGKIVGSIVLNVYQHAELKFIEPWEASPSGAGCKMLVIHVYAKYTYMSVFVSETVTIGLTLIKALQHMGRSSSSWVSQLYRNGILYCTAILLLCLLNVLLSYITSLPKSSAAVLGMLQHVLQSILCSRVMFVILQHRHDAKTDRPDSPNYDHHNHGTIDLSWFSQGRAKLTRITTTPSDLEGYGYALENANGNGMELDRRREDDTAVAFATRVLYDNHRNRKKDEDGKPKRSPRTSVSVSATDGGIELQSPMGQRSTSCSNSRLGGTW